MAKKPAAPEALDPRLLAGILADPDSPAGWAVYGDWLSSRGDVRGELIALQQARAAAAAAFDGAELARLIVAETALLDAHARPFFGPLARSPKARHTHVDWENGFVAGLDAGGFRALGDVLAHPSMQLLRRLRGVELATNALPLLEAVSTFQKHAAALFDLPRLATLELMGFGVELGTVSHPGLRRLALAYAF